MQKWDIPVHTQVRVTHDVAPAILETIKQRHVDLVVMGWKGRTATPGRIFGSATDTIIRQAPCDVILVKWANSSSDVDYCPLPIFKRWLVLIGGGPNSLEAVKLLPALVNFDYRVKIYLLQVVDPEDKSEEPQALKKAKLLLSKQLQDRVSSLVMRASFVPEAAIAVAKNYNCDAIVMGASREGMLKQAIEGNIPEAIASRCDRTVILVRQAISPS